MVILIWLAMSAREQRNNQTLRGVRVQSSGEGDGRVITQFFCFIVCPFAPLCFASTSRHGNKSGSKIYVLAGTAVAFLNFLPHRTL